MPRNVRNWWLEGSIDGRNSKIDGGPQSATGGFRLSILQRDKGDITRAVTIEGRWIDGRLILQAETPDGQQLIRVETER